jgi:hypothetical protein
MPSPEIICPELPEFKSTDLDAVSKAFRDAPVCRLRQTWRSEPESSFLPGIVRVGWQEQTLMVFVELKDAEIFTFARYPNERLWELGDVFEIFLRPMMQPAYGEFQVAPNNLRMQLRFADSAMAEQARQSHSFGGAVVHDIAFTARTWVLADYCRWYALVRIPVPSIWDHPAPLPGSAWCFSFCRYDYSRGRVEPVLSSTSAHAAANNFHCQADWGTLRCERRPGVLAPVNAGKSDCRAGG